MQITSYKDYIENLSEINEASLSRLWQHLTKDGDCIAIISAERGKREGLTDAENAKVNQRQTERLRKYVNIHGYGFNKTVGGFVETFSDGSTAEQKENSTAIYCHCETFDDEKTFKNFCVALGKKYEQECIFFVGLDKHAKWIYTSTSNNNSIGTEMDCGVFHASQIGAYYTKIGKRKFTFVSENVDISDCSWFNYTPTERRYYDFMKVNLKKLTEKNEDYYNSFFNDVSNRLDKYL